MSKLFDTYLSLTELKDIQALASENQVDWLIKNLPEIPKALTKKLKTYEAVKKALCTQIIAETINEDKTKGVVVTGQYAELKLKAASRIKTLKTDDPIKLIQKLGVEVCASAITLSASKLETALGTVNAPKYIKTDYGTRAFQSLKEIV